MSWILLTYAGPLNFFKNFRELLPCELLLYNLLKNLRKSRKNRTYSLIWPEMSFRSYIVYVRGSRVRNATYEGLGTKWLSLHPLLENKQHIFGNFGLLFRAVHRIFILFITRKQYLQQYSESFWQYCSCFIVWNTKGHQITPQFWYEGYILSRMLITIVRDWVSPSLPQSTMGVIE